MHRWLNTRAKSPRDACFRALVDYFGTHLLEHHLRKARHVMRGAKAVEVCGEFRYLIKMADLLAHRAVGIVFVDHHPPCDVSAHNRGNCQNVPHVKSKAVKNTRARARGGRALTWLSQGLVQARSAPPLAARRRLQGPRRLHCSHLSLAPCRQSD